ncbi:MAG: hypothetical protein ACLPT6_14355 [Desulfobaccales bacterium]
MSTQLQSKKEILKDRVVTLVKEFVQAEGGITLVDIEALFGHNPHYEVIAALYQTLRLT